MSKLPLKNTKANSFGFVRHGESESNQARICAGGATDSPLTSNGRQQAYMLAETLTSSLHTYDGIIHTGLSRSLETATILNDRLCLPISENRNLREHHVGDWEGAQWDHVSHYWLARKDPPNGETWAEFYERVKVGLEETRDLYAKPLIVSHGGVFLALLENLVIPKESLPENTAMYEFLFCNQTRNWRFELPDAEAVQPTP